MAVVEEEEEIELVGVATTLAPGLEGSEGKVCGAEEDGGGGRDLYNYEVTMMIRPFDTDTLLQVAFYISTLLLGLAAFGHGFAFCFKKVQERRRKDGASVA